MKAARHELLIKPGLSLGNNAAESDDAYLFECFVTTPAYEQLIDLNSPKMIASGRTGSGKTAILRQIKEKYGKVYDLDPFEISLSYISNSDILRFLHQIGADLDLLFQVLWKHVLCVEYVRMRYAVKDKAKWESALDNLKRIFSHDPKRKRALAYLADFDGKFWKPFDENIKEVADKITNQLELGLEADYAAFKGKASLGEDYSSEKRAEIVDRFRKIIIPEQLQDLAEVINLLADDEQHQVRYYILIDKLDEHWVEDSIRFRLIRALIETLRNFRKIRRLKVVVALRTDVLERMFQTTHMAGTQREKYDDFICDLRWTDAQLRRLIDERVALLSKRHYPDEPITFSDLFPRQIDRLAAFDYILDRTLKRPRDILAFLNQCLTRATGKKDVTATIIREAEREYSTGRLQALIEEWKGAFPAIPVILHHLTQLGASHRFADACARETSEDLVLRIADDPSLKGDPLYDAADRVLATNNDAALEAFMKRAIEMLYRVGAVGVRPPGADHILHSHEDMPLLSPASLSPDAKVRVHPMLRGALHLVDSIR